MVADYLWWSGWREVEVVEVVGKGGGEQEPRGWAGFAAVVGGGRDPVWVVRGRNLGEGG